MELVEIDALELQTAQAAFALLAQVFGAAIGVPHVGTRTHQAALGGDDEIVRVGVEGFGDEVLADLGPVGVGRVDEVDAQLHGAAQHSDGLVVVFGRTPDAGAGDAHGTEAESPHRALTELEGAGGGVLEGVGQSR